MLFGQVGVDVGGPQRLAGAGQLAGQGEVAVALHRPAYVGQGVAAEPLEVRRARPGPASGSTSSSRLASSALTVITVSEWPRMSCRSRANRLRSSVDREPGVLLAGPAAGRRCAASAALTPAHRERRGADRERQAAWLAPAADRRGRARRTTTASRVTTPSATGPGRQHHAGDRDVDRAGRARPRPSAGDHQQPERDQRAERAAAAAAGGARAPQPQPAVPHHANDREVDRGERERGDQPDHSRATGRGAAQAGSRSGSTRKTSQTAANRHAEPPGPAVAVGPAAVSGVVRLTAVTLVLVGSDPGRVLAHPPRGAGDEERRARRRR